MYYKMKSKASVMVLVIVVIVINHTLSIKSFDNEQSNHGKYKCENGVQYAYDPVSLTTSIVKYEGTASELILPSSIVIQEDTYIVTSVGEQAFSGAALDSVVLPDTVNIIGSGAFFKNNLWSLVIPDSVRTIGEEAFAHNRLTSLTLGNALETIGSSAFSNNKLIHVTIPDSVSSIGGRAFYNNQLTTVHIGNGISIIKENTFTSNQLSNVVLPNSVTTIENHAFNNNPLLHSVFIPRSVIHVGDSVFGLSLLERIYTDDGYGETLIDILDSNTMKNIGVNYIKMMERQPRYHEDLSSEHSVAIGESISLDVISGTMFMHDNTAMTWKQHVAQIQWYKDGEPIPDARELKYVVADIHEDSTYYAIVDEERLHDIQVKLETTDQLVYGRLDTTPLHELQLDDNTPQEYNSLQDGTSDTIVYVYIYFSIGLIALLGTFRLLRIYLARKHG